jgi:hypothetical protein
MEPQKGRFLATTANMCESVIQVYYIEALITVVKRCMEQAQKLI